MLHACLWLVMWSKYTPQILTAGKSPGFPAVICTCVYKERIYLQHHHLVALSNYALFLDLRIIEYDRCYGLDLL